MSINNMKILVTGSGGFVGSHLVRRLKEMGAQVIAFDHGRGCDVCDFEQFSKVDRFDVMVHLAAKTFVPYSYVRPREFYSTNMLGTLNALELCRLRKARMVFAGSYVYGVPQYLPIDEKHPVVGFNPYSGSKVVCEQLCERYSNDLDVQVTVLRLFNIYGAGQNGQFLIPTIIEQAKNGRVVLKDPKPKRDYVYIDDVVEAYVKAIEYQCRGLTVINIGSGESFSVENIVSEVLKNFDSEVQLEFTGEERKAEVPDTIAEINKAAELIGWCPQVSFPDGIKNCVVFARQA